MVSDELLNVAENYAASPDKGQKFFRELAAKQLAVFKGLGFAAGYLGGIAKAEIFGEIIDLAESYGPDDWRDFIREIQFSQPDEFFLFEHDRHTCLSEPTQINPEYLQSLREPPKSKQVTLNYRLSRLVHSLAFTRDKGMYGFLRRLFAPLGQEAGLDDAAGPRGGAAIEAADVRLPGLRRLQPARLRLSLPSPRLLEVAVSTVPAAARRGGVANWTTRSVSGPACTSG